MPTQSQINTNLNLSEEVETGASNIPNDVLTEMSVDAPVEPPVEGSPLVEEIQPPSNDPLPTTTNAAIEFDPTEIVVDPGLRKPIEEYDINIRDIVRREYLLRGPCQPIGYVYPKKIQSGRQRSFLESWFKKYPWLEYSVHEDAAFCFYCYLFKQPRCGDNFGGDAFTTEGVSNWKNATQIFREHVGKVDSLHNCARQHCEDFRNQRQSVDNVIQKITKEQQEEYLG